MLFPKRLAVQPSPPENIQTALLYQACKPADPDEFIKHINKVIDFTGLEFESTIHGHGRNFFIVGGGLYIQVEQSLNPLAAGGFHQTLSSPFTRISFPEAGEAVRSHTSHVLINIGKGIPMPAITGIDLPDAALSKGEFSIALTLAQVATNFFFHRAEPMAVHWGQSNILLSGKAYGALAQQPDPMPLYIHPSLFSSRAVVRGRQVIGFRTFGAAHFLGKEIVFNEAPVPLDWMLSRVYSFVGTMRERGELPPAGDSFGLSADEVIRISYNTPSPEDPEEFIGLSLERCPEFGIGDVEPNPSPVPQSAPPAPPQAAPQPRTDPPSGMRPSPPARPERRPYGSRTVFGKRRV
ncbi:hypothetical protein GR183_09025 [Stappia sp. GBMRC 2046]|uniref:DUF4261 domain-containing protein n=1 Tax=Stappia sediminis TaxID=2692190 RepID=A0A7X3LTY2_9HYPH|nr:hypothetical protein [Stappia sediminis]MXN65047.1 hypothetical protein [Stappia sediminis]